MNDQLLRTFIELVTFDSKVRSLHDEHENLLNLKRNLIEQKNTLFKRLEELRLLLNECQKYVNTQELSMKILDNREAELKSRLDNVNGIKEYSSLRNEINTVHDQQQVCEQNLIEAWDKFDSTQKKYKAEQALFDAKNIELDDQQRVISAKIRDLESLIDEHERQRQAYAEAVPADLLSNYEHMCGQVKNPVVPVEHNSCSACFYPIPAHDLALLKHGKFLPCKSCYRILYCED
jgi:predicted  nucleic acid-binding Zn-ribbon protein